MDVLRTLLADVNLTCFADIYEHVKKIWNPNVFVLCNLLVVNPATSCTPESYFSTAKPGWDQQWPAEVLLNVHKELTDKLDLAEAGNEFISSRIHWRLKDKQRSVWRMFFDM